MENSINNISVKDFFWIKFSENSLSVGLPAISPDIHLTLSYHKDDPDFNIHITKNTTDKNNKPKVEICRINKELLEETMKASIWTFIGNLVEPIKTQPGNDLSYVATDDIQQPMEQLFPKVFTETDYKKSKRKLKVTADVVSKLTSLAQMEEVQALFSSRKPLGTSVVSLESGIVVSEQGSIAAMKLFDGWYQLREINNFTDILTGVVDARTIKGLKMRFKRAVVVVSKSNPFAETQLENRRSIVLNRS